MTFITQKSYSLVIQMFMCECGFDEIVAFDYLFIDSICFIPN